MNETVLGALIAGGFSIVVALIYRMGARNDRDHAENGRKLDRIEDKIDGHINDHARRGLG